MNDLTMHPRQLFSSFGRHIAVGVTLLAAINIVTLTRSARAVAGGEGIPSTRDLKIQYAEATLQLARVELKLAEKYNRDFAKSVGALVAVSDVDKSRILETKQLSQATIERLKSNVIVAEEQLHQATLTSTGGSERVFLRYAEEKLRLAKVRLKATVARKSHDTEARKLEVDRAQLKHELARLQVEMLRNPKHLQTIVESLYMRADRLSEEVVVLEQRIAALEDRSVRQLAP